MRKMCLMPYANNKGADQPAHPRSLISAFVVRCLDSIISLDSIAEISRLASFCGCAGRFVSCRVEDSRRHIFSWRGSYIHVSRSRQQCKVPSMQASYLHGSGYIYTVAPNLHMRLDTTKRVLGSFRPGQTQIGLRSHRS